MSVISEIINGISINSILLFFVTLILLFLSAYTGKFFFKKRHGNNSVLDSETNIILGAVLSLLGLLIGFVLSISIEGYNNRQKTEENEAIVIGKATQYTELLSLENQDKAKKLLQQYITARVEFFKTGKSKEHDYWKDISLEKQLALWQIAVKEANNYQHSTITPILSAYSDLYISQQKTMASWKNQIPNAAWFLLIVFAICANILIGYNVRGLKGRNWLIFILPILTTLALFMIAEIDMPGEGIIHVAPDNLLLLQEAAS